MFILFIFLEIVFLSLTSKKVHQSLGTFFYSVTRSEQATIKLFSLIFLPGTIIHELSHALMATILFVNVGKIEFTPEIHPDGIKLGSAQIALTDPFRRALIGLAPFLFGLIILISIMYYLFLGSTQALKIPYSVWVLVIYSIFVLVNTIFSSRKDLEGTLEVGLFILAIFIALYLLDFKQVFIFLENFINLQTEFFKVISLILLIPLTINLGILSLVKLVLKRN